MKTDFLLTYIAGSVGLSATLASAWSVGPAQEVRSLSTFQTNSRGTSCVRTHKTAASALYASVRATDEYNARILRDRRSYPVPSDSESGVPTEEDITNIPRHESNENVNHILQQTEKIIKGMHEYSISIKSSNDTADYTLSKSSSHNNGGITKDRKKQILEAKKVGREHETIYANNYVDLSKVDTIGLDYDYTLVSYTEDLLELIYDMALRRLVSDRQYPIEMLDAGLKYDPFFSVRGLAVDQKTGWVCHLSYTHKVAVAWEGREKLPTSRIYQEYRGKRALKPADRKKRIKPLNDLFSMSECCLIADVVQFFKDRDIPFCPQNVVTDVINIIGSTHMSGDFHRIVAQSPERYFEPTPHLKQTLLNLKTAGKRLIFVSNSPFWYVDAGMRYIFGSSWTKEWDAIITSAGKPKFYTDESRPFREICLETRRALFKRVDSFEKGKVYTEGCLRELTRLMDWSPTSKSSASLGHSGTAVDECTIGSISTGSLDMATANVLYIGDSLFADLVDAKREFGWTTAAVTPEVGYEMDIQSSSDYVLVRRTIDTLLNALRRIQVEMGNGLRSDEDIYVLNTLESLVSMWRDRESDILGNPFGSVFRARYQPSLFAHSLRRYCDLYMTSVSSLRHYSPQHRFYPEQNHLLLAHEISNAEPECWTLDEVLDETE